MTCLFEIDGREILALNGGPHFKFTPAVSLIVKCDGRSEVGMLWGRFSDGAAPGHSGWLTDKSGVSWQIAPRPLPAFLLSEDAEGVDRVMRAVMTMKKLDIAELPRAFGPN